MSRDLKVGEFVMSGPDGEVAVTTKSSFTGAVNTMTLPVTEAQLDRFFRREALIQDIFPDLSDEQREFLLTGVTPAEWNAVFGKKEAE